MWDEACDYLLSSKHDRLSIGSGEIGFEDTNVNSLYITTEHGQSDLRAISPDELAKKQKTSLRHFKGGGGYNGSIINAIHCHGDF